MAEPFSTYPQESEHYEALCKEDSCLEVLPMMNGLNNADTADCNFYW
jgi:hypothetical protein